jgi:hypothetical protein
MMSVDGSTGGEWVRDGRQQAAKMQGARDGERGEDRETERGREERRAQKCTGSAREDPPCDLASFSLARKSQLDED